MSPANQILILAPPRGLLVLRIANDPRSTKLPHRQILHRPGLRAYQHNLALHILPRVVTLLGALTDIYQVRGHIGALAVLCQHDRFCLITRHLFLAAGRQPLVYPDSVGIAFI